MSLMVHAYRRAGPDAPLEYLAEEPPAPANQLAGPEGSRSGFWGHPALARRGLGILPFLREGDVYAEGAQLDALEREAAVILGDLEEIARETRSDPEWVRFRVSNILAAIQQARGVKDGIGGVYIG